MKEIDPDDFNMLIHEATFKVWKKFQGSKS